MCTQRIIFFLTSVTPPAVVNDACLDTHLLSFDHGADPENAACDGILINALQEPAKDKFRYICVGSLDDIEALPPKGEFFCSTRASWMPEIPDIFHKQKIQD